MQEQAGGVTTDERAGTNGWAAPSGPAATPATPASPASPVTPVTPVAPIDQSALSLPTSSPKASLTVDHGAPANPLSYLDVATPPPSRRRKQKRGGGGLILLFLLVAIVTAGAIFGPGLYDEYLAEEEAAPEPSAPLAFPTVVASSEQVRTATFELDGLPAGSEAIYTITVDFDTWVSRVVIDRTDAPDLEVLTFSDDALVRRLDSETWYQLDRGSFPFDEQLQRTDWVRSLDDLLPAAQRADIEITSSTEAVVGGVTTRHLVLAIDPSTIVATTSPIDELDPMGDIADAVETPTADPATSPAPEPVEPAVGSSTVPSPSTPVSPTATATGTASGDVAERDAADAPSDAVGATVPVELWIDGRGIVRRSLGGDVLGIRDTTLLETSDLAWVPEYPDASQVLPMTAGALIELGL